MADSKLTLLSTTILLLLTVFSAVMLFIQTKVALLYLFGLHKPTGDVFCFGGGEEEGTFVQEGNSSTHFEHRFCTATAFGHLLEANPQLILLEPDYLVGVHLKQKSALLSFESAWKRHWADRGWLSSGDKEKMVKKYAEALADWKDLQWRFDLPTEGFGSSTHSLTVGLISWPKTSVEDLFKSLKLTGFELFEEVSGAVHHDNSSNVHQPLHYFIVNKDSYLLSGGNQSQANFTDFQPLLLLHIVVLHRVAEFIWVGGVPAETGEKLQKLISATSVNSSKLLPLHFGAEYEQIYDPFTGVASSADGHFWVSVPEDISHLLSQLPTARYLYCPPERGVAWFAETGRQPNEPYERISLLAYRQMKALARHLRMEVWIACGTLLGWYRQCTVTPYTGDTDFASWAKYVQNKSTSNFNAETTLQEALEELESQLGLYRRFGEPTATLEYTFLYAVQERVDLFFAYSNGSHLMTPLHEPISGRYTYNVYPPFRLCSVALLGVKLLAPCDPERLITVEYGATWRQPITPYNYLSGPLNTLPLRAYNFSKGEQQQQPQQVKYSGLPPPPKHWEPKALEVFLQNLTAKLEGYF